MQHRRRQRWKLTGVTLLEVIAVVTILAVVAIISWPRASGGNAAAKKAACEANQGDIEIQVELWRHNTGALPMTNLSNIGGDLKYFGSGLPVCPVDGTGYTINATGRVVGHNH